MNKLYLKKIKQRAKVTMNRSVLGLLLLAGFVPTLAASQVDFEQEIVIVAKKQSSDLKNKIASYMEDVKITQGSLKIEADVVQVKNQADSDHKTYLATGNPAKFSQLLDDGQRINLQANEISYQPATNIIIIKGNASVSQEGSMVKGDIITYNIATEQLSAESTEAVTTILKPEIKDQVQDEDKDKSTASDEIKQ